MIFMNALASAVTAAAAEASNLASNVEAVGTSKGVDRIGNFLKTLGVMWKGMLGIFAVMGVILFTIYILSKFFKQKPEEE